MGNGGIEVGVERVPAVALQVPQLRRREDEGIEPVVDHTHRDRVGLWKAVTTNGDQERFAMAGSVEERPSVGGNVRRGSRKLTPGSQHRPPVRL